MEHLFDAPAGMPAEEPVAPPRGQLREQTADRLYDLMRASPPFHPFRGISEDEIAGRMIGRQNADLGPGAVPTIWRTAAGDNIRLVDMTDAHLYNTYSMVLSRRRECLVWNQPAAARVLETWIQAFRRERQRRENANRFA